MIDTLNTIEQNQGLVQVLFTAVVALATVVYMAFTGLMWREMKRTNDRLVKPNVHVFLEPGDRHSIIFNLRVANLGASPVHNLRVYVDPPDVPALLADSVAELSLFRRTIPVLGQGQEISTDLFSFLEAHDKEAYNWIEFRVEYEGVDGKQRTQSFQYDLDVWYGLSAKDHHSLNDVTKELKNIAKQIEKTTKSVGEIAQKAEWSTRSQYQESATSDFETEARAFIRLWRDYRSREEGRFILPFEFSSVEHGAERIYRCLVEQKPDYQNARSLAHSIARTQRFMGPDSHNQFLATGDALVDWLTEFIYQEEASSS